jgi:hypothetical protein
MRTLFFLIAALLAAEASGQGHQQWRNVTNSSFSFSIPASWERTSGIGSPAEEYLGAGIWVSFNFGIYSDFGSWPKQTKFEEMKINGRAARVGTAKREFHEGYPYSTQVYVKINESVNESVALVMFAACKSEKEVALARKVFETIVLNEKKS